MNINEIKSDILNEKYYKINHPSGLTVYVLPKENYSSAYAVFGTKYGSIDTRFKRSDSDKWRVSLIFSSTNFLKVRIWTLLKDMQKQAPAQMPIPRLTKPAIFSNAAVILRRI